MTRPHYPAGRMGGGAVAPSVLIADPDEATRIVLRTVLGERGYRACFASTAEEALGMLRDPPHALVTELVFPDRGGLDIVRAARSTGRNTVVLVLSEVGNENSVIAALRAGAHDYVRKPFSPGELVARLERHAAPQ